MAHLRYVLPIFALTACGGTNTTAPAVTPPSASFADATAAHRITHVLLLSVDGMHQADLVRYAATHPHSRMAQLIHSGVSYERATGSKPSDSFPGLLALLTGASAATTGVYYDASYDRQLSPPGSNCATVGTPVIFDESIDKDLTRLDGGGGIDTTRLPRDPNHGCSLVYPWMYPRVNNIFEVAHDAGLRTAWSDKHIGAYTIVQGPSGHGVDDLANLEVTGKLPDGGSANDDVSDNITYDNIKVGYVLNWIKGLDHTGVKHIGVPAIFGMNFQTVSTGEKVNGYLSPDYTPTPELARAFDFIDSSLSKFENELGRQKIWSQTLVILAAKHGQTPVNRALKRIIADSLIPTEIDSLSPNLVANATEDDIALIWLNNQQLTAAAADKIALNQPTNKAQTILFGNTLTAGNHGFPGFPSPLIDSRTPDIIVLPQKGVIYAGPSAKKVAEHGGWNDEDVDEPMLLSLPGLTETHVWTPIKTRQVAPTILQALGLQPGKLRGAQLEGTQILPGWTDALSHRMLARTLAVR